MSAFDRAVELVLKWEGGYVNDPRDPGGETNFGISKRSYPAEDVRALTRERAIALYHRDYWQPIQGDALPPMLALAVFDAAVNMGVGTAIRLLQRTLGVPVDGVIGPQTLQAAARHADALAVRTFQAQRVLQYAKMPTFPTFGFGWVARALDVYHAAVSTA
jgi:lysozyme family protein